MKSILTKNQKRRFEKIVTTGHNQKQLMIVEARLDDECGNGHNTFAITGTLYSGLKDREEDFECGGCIHGEITKYFPELAHLIKWHLTSTDGPMHYIANTVYWVEKLNGHSKWQDSTTPEQAYKYAKSTAIWEDATVEDFAADPMPEHDDTPEYYGAPLKPAPKPTYNNLKIKLLDRHAQLMADFHKAMTSAPLDFTY